MNIKLPDPQQFNFKDCVIAGDECVLVTPKDMGVEWNDDNKYFRSSIWRKSDMKPVSLGFRKFMNYGEKPDFEPLDPRDGVRAIRKIDGSCLLVNDYRGELVVRTRGTVDASKLENGHEIELLKKKYPKAFKNEWLECGLWTLLFEWTTPTNRIVLNESIEPTLWLIGMVFHGDYSYASQRNLDQYAKAMGVKRPESYGISLSGGIEFIKQQIEPLQDIEGVVIYDDRAGDDSGQILKKIKTLRYLKLHRVFTGIKSVDHLFDLWVDHNTPDRDVFENQLSTEYDWELVTSLQSLMDELFLRWKQIQTQLSWIRTYLTGPDFLLLDRKHRAMNILQMFPKTSGFVFAMMDGKDVSPQKLWRGNWV